MSISNLAELFDTDSLGFQQSLEDMGFSIEDFRRDSLLVSNLNDLDRFLAAEDDANEAVATGRDIATEEVTLTKQVTPPPESVDEELVDIIQREPSDFDRELDRHFAAEDGLAMSLSESILQVTSVESIQREMNGQHQPQAQVVQTSLPDRISSSTPRLHDSDPTPAAAPLAAPVTKRQDQKSRKTIKANANFDLAPYNHVLYQKQARRSSSNDEDTMLMKMSEFKSRSRCPEKSATQGRRRKSVSDLDGISPGRFDFPHFRADNNQRPPKQRRATVDSATATSSNLCLIFGQSGCRSPPTTPSDLLGHRDLSNLQEDHETTATVNAFHYHGAFIKLAESMKRTEMSRRRLVMHYTSLAQQHVPAGAPAGTVSLAGRPTPGDSLPLYTSEGRSYTVNAFRGSVSNL